MRKFFSLIAAVLFAGSMMADNYVLFSGELVEGDYLITYEGGAMKASVASNRFQYDAVEDVAGVIADPAANLIWHLAKVGDNWTMYNADQQKYAGSTGSKNQGALLADATTDNAKWTLTAGTETYDFANVARAAGSNPGNKWLRRNGTYGFACYAESTGGALKLYKLQEGEAPAVAKPVISGDAKFYDEAEVTIECATEGATIYYTMNGSDPDANSIQYLGSFFISSSLTIKAIAIKGEDASEIASKAFTLNPSFDSFEALIAAGVEHKTLVEVSFEDIVITGFYDATYNDVTSHKGIYFNVNEVEYEMYNSSATISDSWEVGGTVSGTIRGEWQHYVNTGKGIDIWEIVPMANDWDWESLTYQAPGATAIDNTDAAAKAVKFFENGQLIILKNGVRYNAQGAIVK